MKQLYSCFLHMVLSRTWKMRTVRRRYQEQNMGVTKLFASCWWAPIAVQAINVSPSWRGVQADTVSGSLECSKIALTILFSFSFVFRDYHINCVIIIPLASVNRQGIELALIYVTSRWISWYNIDATFISSRKLTKLSIFRYFLLIYIDRLRVVHMNLSHPSAIWPPMETCSHRPLSSLQLLGGCLFLRAELYYILLTRLYIDEKTKGLLLLLLLLCYSDLALAIRSS